MKKRDGGFTLIELLIALAVLSIMAGVLLQSFVISRRMNTKARKDELVLDAAKRTMEELKGYPFEKLELFLAEGGENPGDGSEGGSGSSGSVIIGNTVYRVERLEDSSDSDSGTEAKEVSVSGENPPSSGLQQGYRLITEYGRDASGSGKAAYLICAEADYEKYNSTEAEDQEKSFSINQYQMPNIADISSFQNVVIEPQALMKDDKSLTSQLLLKVNPDEEDGEDSGEGEADGSGSSGSEDVTEYTEDDVKRYLWLSIRETAAADDEDGEAGTLAVQAQAVYTVKETEGNSYSAEEAIEASLASVKKNVVKDEKTGLPANRVYLFLPDHETKYIWTSEEADGKGETEESGFPGFDRIYIGYSLEEEIEFFMVAANPDQYKENESDNKVAIEPEEGTELLIYSNIDGKEPVSWKDAENRLYHLTVTVYEADYSGTGAENGEPERGREVLKLDSTKTE